MHESLIDRMNPCTNESLIARMNPCTPNY